MPLDVILSASIETIWVHIGIQFVLAIRYRWDFTQMGYVYLMICNVMSQWKVLKYRIKWCNPIHSKILTLNQWHGAPHGCAAFRHNFLLFFIVHLRQFRRVESTYCNARTHPCNAQAWISPLADGFPSVEHKMHTFNIQCSHGYVFALILHVQYL